MYYQTQRNSDMRRWRLEAFFIAVGLTALGFLVKAGVTDKAKDQTITVQGIAEAEVTAGKIVWPIVYKELGSDLSYLQYNITSKNKLITDFLKANGVTDDEFRVLPVEVSDTQTDRLLVNRPYQRYIATSVIVVTSNEVEKIHKLLSDQNFFWRQSIVAINDDSRYTIAYEYENFNSIKAKLMEEAVTNARLTVEEFASGLEYKIGKLKKASQEQCIITDNLSTSFKKKLRVEVTADFYLQYD